MHPSSMCTCTSTCTCTSMCICIIATMRACICVCTCCSLTLIRACQCQCRMQRQVGTEGIVLSQPEIIVLLEEHQHFTCTGLGRRFPDAPNCSPILMTTFPPKECPIRTSGKSFSCDSSLRMSCADDSTPCGPGGVGRLADSP